LSVNDGDVSAILHRLSHRADDRSAQGLGHLAPKVAALAAIGAAVALDADTTSYMSLVGMALDTGVTRDEVIGCLLAVASIVGVVRLVAAAPRVSLALGYDVGDALEAL